MAGIIVIIVLNDKKLSSHMGDIGEHINHSNHKIHSYDKSRKIIVNLGNEKYEYNNNSTYQSNHIQNSLLMIIVNTPENDASKLDSKLDKRELRTYSIKSLSMLFSCSIRAMYNRFHRDQNKRLMLKSYIPWINT